MKLDLRFSNRPLEDLWCQAVVAFVFQSPDVEGGALSNLNKKMVGSLIELEKKGLWTGARGETFLLAAQSMIKSDKVLFYGLGQSSDFDMARLEEGVRALGPVLDKIEVKEFGIHIPVVEGLEEAHTTYLESSAQLLVDQFLENHGNEPDFLLKIIFSVEDDLMDRLSPMVSRLREHFTSLLDFSIIIDRETSSQTSEEIG